jgi:hypothetical protein
VTHSIGEIQWDETEPTHVVGRSVATHEAGVQVHYELHVYAAEDEREATVWCEMYYSIGDSEHFSRPAPACSFREETVGSAKAALARQIELEWR